MTGGRKSEISPFCVIVEISKYRGTIDQVARPTMPRFSGFVAGLSVVRITFAPDNATPTIPPKFDPTNTRSFRRTCGSECAVGGRDAINSGMEFGVTREAEMLS